MIHKDENTIMFDFNKIDFDVIRGALNRIVMLMARTYNIAVNETRLSVFISTNSFSSCNKLVVST